jgi:YggT family protein
MTLVYNFVNIFFNILSLAILARVLLSWVSVNPFNPIVSLLDQITEPILGPLRRVIPPLGMIDITPIVALFLLQFLQRILLSFIAGAF